MEPPHTMTADVRALPASFKGIQYRSRLEARWAVFMDFLGIPFVYESEAYRLGEGICYLPDFWIPSLLTFIEIKPTKDFPDDGRYHKLADVTNQTVCVAFGQPPGDPTSMRMWYLRSDFGIRTMGMVKFTRCPSCGQIDLVYGQNPYGVNCACSFDQRNAAIQIHWSTPPYPKDPLLEQAIYTARVHSFWTPPK